MHNLAADFAAYNAAHPTRRIDLDGLIWHYAEAGAGATPLLMLPGGFGVAASSWRYLLALGADRRVVSLHYPPEITTIAGLADGVVDLMDALGIGRAYLLGGSASGFVAQVAVRRHPARVAGLILAQSGAPRPHRALLSRGLAALFARARAPLILATLRVFIHIALPGPHPDRAFWRDHFVDVVAEQSRAALVGRFELAADFDARYRLAPADLDGWHGPMAILEAGGDRLVGPGERAALRALYPCAELITLPGRHHDSVERPEAQIATIAALLARWDARH